ncbi:hypothetical protein SD70_13725 [Gordoniibacillus kamchatkensis]|uniref:Glycerate kinase n=1 Tax=Gordoniibacillus kamchatkensis TaxID=1590651 RepID=A0ABR5AI68_9BACL|nr:hypothetical protein [Paenibacillus sp. VKM B-2647]KIL40458.1 hypothetical protein SD70_13725 [Paenibacillus sp. VKM B-2647]
MIEQYGTPWFLRRKTSLKRIRSKLKIVSLGIAADSKGDEELTRAKYPEANVILQSAEDLFRLAEVVDEGLDVLLTKLAIYKDERGNRK